MNAAVGIIDYGMGNLLSVRHALERLGSTARICNRPEHLSGVGRIILPGVGAFRKCMANLRGEGLVQALEEAVLRQGKPVLGICLGMEAMARRSFEDGEHQGLGWFDADVVHLQPGCARLRVPQIGWNEVTYRPDSPIFAGLPPAPDFYFVHSYYMRCDSDADVDATCDYGGLVTAGVRKANVVGTQFHPEKSQDCGLKVLENFVRWNP